jgi:hypothetical protein
VYIIGNNFANNLLSIFQLFKKKINEFNKFKINVGRG